MNSHVLHPQHGHGDSQCVQQRNPQVLPRDEHLEQRLKELGQDGRRQDEVHVEVHGGPEGVARKYVHHRQEEGHEEDHLEHHREGDRGGGQGLGPAADYRRGCVLREAWQRS